MNRAKTPKLQRKIRRFVDAGFIFSFILFTLLFVGNFSWDKALRGKDLGYAAICGLLISGIFRGLELERRAALKRAKDEWKEANS